MLKLRLASRLILSTVLILTVSIFAGNTRAAEPVSLITDFGYNGRHAYFFVALDKGYYSAANLDVKILRGQGSVDAIRQTGNNNATFGFADAGSLVLARGNDKIPVKLAAIVYAKPPKEFFAAATRASTNQRILRAPQSPIRRAALLSTCSRSMQRPRVSTRAR